MTIQGNIEQTTPPAKRPRARVQPAAGTNCSVNAEARKLPSQKWRINELKEHPRQRELFEDLSDGELDELATSLDSDGLKNPVEILPDGTIVCGHQRIRAAKKLGWDEIDVVVRHDLSGEGAILAELIRDNLDRRHLSEFDIARPYDELRKLAKAAGKLRGQGTLRDQLAKRFGPGFSGRKLDRLKRLLELPAEFQNFIRRGQLTQQNGERLLRLDLDRLDQAAEQIRNGADAQTIVKELLQGDGAKSALNDDAAVYRKVVKVLGCDLRRLGQIADFDDLVRRGQTDSSVAIQTIDESIELLKKLRTAEKAKQRQQKKNIAEKVQGLSQAL